MAHIAIDARIISSTTGRYVERLLTYLQDIDTLNHYTVIVRKKDENYWRPTAPNFSVKVADYKPYSFGEQFGFRTFLDNLSADLVHFCMPQQPIFYVGQKVTTFHDLTLIKTYNSDKNWLIFHVKQLVGKFVFKKVAHDNDHIITISEYTKQDLRAFANLPDKKVSVTYEAGETASQNEVLYSTPFNRFVMYVGSQSDYKNIKRLGQAHQRLVQLQPDLGLVLVGKKDKAALANEAYFNENKYRNIYFTDFISDEQLNWLYRRASAYVFPSLMEGFGLPGLEAMAYGVPVVSSNATCLPEIYGPAAAYFDPLNTEQMANAINNVISDPMQRSRLVTAGGKQIKKYSWKKMAQETYNVYQQILDPKAEVVEEETDELVFKSSSGRL